MELEETDVRQMRVRRVRNRDIAGQEKARRKERGIDGDNAKETKARKIKRCSFHSMQHESGGSSILISVERRECCPSY